MTQPIDPTLPTLVTPADLAMHQSAVTMLDVRSPAEFASAHIPGSYNVPLELLPEHAAELGSAIGEPLVLVCRSGMRARQAEHTLRAADFPRLHVLDGGLAAWEGASLALKRGRSHWGMERQVRGVAGSIAMSAALAGLFIWRPLGGIAAAIGGGLFVSALTDSCTMARVLGKLPYNQSMTCDVSSVIEDLGSRRAPTSGSTRPLPSSLPKQGAASQ